jgi:hypothetical protein
MEQQNSKEEEDSGLGSMEKLRTQHPNTATVS